MESIRREVFDYEGNEDKERPVTRNVVRLERVRAQLLFFGFEEENALSATKRERQGTHAF